MRRRICFILFAIILCLSVFNPASRAQGTKLGTQKVAGISPQQNFGIDNHFLLREAERQVRLLDFEQADITLDYAVAQNPQSIDALVQRAKYNKMLGRRAKAEADINLVNRLNPYAADLYGYNGPRGILNVLVFQPGLHLLKPNGFHLLPFYYSRLEHSDRNLLVESERLFEVLGFIEEEKLPEALEKLDGLLWVFPESTMALELKAMILIMQGNYNKAEIALQKAANLETVSAVVWHYFSQLEHQRKNYSKALEYSNRAISLQPDLTIAYLQRASLYKVQGDLNAALADYNQILNESDDLFSAILINRGLTRKMAGDFPGALADFNWVLENMPAEARLYKNRANLYLLFGFTNLAITDYTEAITKEANFGEAYYNRGLAHLLRYDPLTACYDLEKSAELGFEKAAEMQRFFCVE